MKNITLAIFLLSLGTTNATETQSIGEKWIPRYDQSPREYVKNPQLPEDTSQISVLAMGFIFNRLNLGIYNSIGLTQETLPIAIVLVENSDKIGSALVAIGTALGNPTLMAVGGAALAVAGKKEPVLKVLRSLKGKIKL
jgi:hypothetical protein